MQLSRDTIYRNTPTTYLGSKELPESGSVAGEVHCSFDGKEFSLGIRGHVGDQPHWYTLTLTLKEVRVLLSRSLEDYWGKDEEIPDAEKTLWKTFFELWEKRIEAKDKEGDE